MTLPEDVTAGDTGHIANHETIHAAINALGTTYQALDSDLTAIAALSTTTYGRALLALADQAALVALLPSYQPLDSDLTAIAALTTTSFGRGLLELADAAALGANHNHDGTYAAARTVIPVEPQAATANSGWSTVLDGGRILSGGSQNESITLSMPIDADGTYTLSVIHTASVSRGIYTPTIDAASLTSLSGSADTFDGYAGSTTTTKTAITGLVLTAGVYALKFTMATKNASSSGYFGDLTRVFLIKTA